MVRREDLRAIPETWRGYLDAARGLADTPRRRAAAVAKRLVGRGDDAAPQDETMAEASPGETSPGEANPGLVNRDTLSKLVRFELDRALSRVGLATAEEVAELTGRVRELERRLRAWDAGSAEVPLVTGEPGASELGVTGGLAEQGAAGGLAEVDLAGPGEAGIGVVGPGEPTAMRTARKAGPAKVTPAKATPAKKATPGDVAPSAKKAAAKATAAKKAVPAKATPAKKTAPGKVVPGKAVAARKATTPATVVPPTTTVKKAAAKKATARDQTDTEGPIVPEAPAGRGSSVTPPEHAVRPDVPTQPGTSTREDQP